MMFEKSQKFKKRIAPLNGHIVNDTIALVAENAGSGIPSGSFVILMDKKHKIHIVDLLQDSWEIQLFEGAVYSVETRMVLATRLSSHIAGTFETFSTRNLAKIFPHLKQHRRKELVGVGMLVPIDIAGVIRKESVSHEVTFCMSDGNETNVYVSDGVPVAGTTDYVYGRLFPSESNDYLHMTKHHKPTNSLHAMMELFCV